MDAVTTRPHRALERAVHAALHSVKDPHLWVGLDEMGMVTGVDVQAESGRVEVTLVYPCIGCPATELIEAAIRHHVTEVEGVSEVVVKVSWSHVWSKRDLAPAVAKRVEQFGIRV